MPSFHSFRLFYCPSVKFLSLIDFFIPSIHIFFDLALFRFPNGVHFITSSGECLSFSPFFAHGYITSSIASTSVVLFYLLFLLVSLYVSDSYSNTLFIIVSHILYFLFFQVSLLHRISFRHLNNSSCSFYSNVDFLIVCFSSWLNTKYLYSSHELISLSLSGFLLRKEIYVFLLISFKIYNSSIFYAFCWNYFPEIFVNCGALLLLIWSKYNFLKLTKISILYSVIILCPMYSNLLSLSQRTYLILRAFFVICKVGPATYAGK